MSTAKAKVFQTAGGQAIQLPEEFRIADDIDEVRIRRVGNSIVFELPQPLPGSGDDWASLDDLTPFSDDAVKAIYDEFGYPDDGPDADKKYP